MTLLLGKIFNSDKYLQTEFYLHGHFPSPTKNHDNFSSQSNSEKLEKYMIFKIHIKLMWNVIKNWFCLFCSECFSAFFDEAKWAIALESLDLEFHISWTKTSVRDNLGQFVIIFYIETIGST
jgi:hypothetical protein